MAGFGDSADADVIDLDSMSHDHSPGTNPHQTHDDGGPVTNASARKVDSRLAQAPFTNPDTLAGSSEHHPAEEDDPLSFYKEEPESPLDKAGFLKRVIFEEASNMKQ